MAERMHGYWTRAIHGLSKREKEPIRLSSFAIYLDRAQYRTDRGNLGYEDEFGTMCVFRYNVLRLWEMDPTSVLGLGTPFLAPLAPLMRSPDPMATVLESKRKILAADPGVVPRRRKADLCGALSLFAGLVLADRNLIQRLVWEDWMGLERSVIAREWIRLGREKGIEKGKEEGLLEARRSDLLAVLRSRFGKIDPKLRRAILRIRDAELLQALLARAAVVRSLKAFARQVNP